MKKQNLAITPALIVPYAPASVNNKLAAVNGFIAFCGLNELRLRAWARTPAPRQRSCSCGFVGTMPILKIIAFICSSHSCLGDKASHSR